MLGGSARSNRAESILTEVNDSCYLGGTLLASCSPSCEDLKVLSEKAGNLDLKSRKKNRTGLSRHRPRKAKLVEAPAGDSGGGQW